MLKIPTKRKYYYFYLILYIYLLLLVLYIYIHKYKYRCNCLYMRDAVTKQMILRKSEGKPKEVNLFRQSNGRD
jgi:hypothetical protein